MSDTELPPLLNRHWTEYVLALSAIIISAISLWVAVDTEYTNRHLVEEASWPFLAIDYSTLDREGRSDFSLVITNAGIGPAKIETLEVFWNGKPYRSASALLKACCGYNPRPSGAQPDKSNHPVTGLITSTSAGTVLRAGQALRFIRYALTPDNAKIWGSINLQKDNISYRVCYCSVFNKCWLSNGHDLNPPRVDTCPRPKVDYNN